MPVAAKSLEIIAGYVLTERIGAGGYGEVWKATAPGGIEKAIKTLHGYHDEELASRELKALERIKGVRHPFLLSLDRFEIVDGRLVVVSELADMSLEDCFGRHRLDGRPGIPRDQLLAYLRDAADALDFMQRQHGLQHLDIKPENLLLLGDHIKVADFGLVKEVGCTRNSMVGGLTPTYAAPEIFDNQPTARTDQYSLAIVYQEMLTGELPFRGRTPTQLVAQHTQGRPQLGALPEHDRPVVLKALAKRPADRYESCTAFIETLIQAADRTRPIRSDASLPARKTTLAHDETQGAGSHATESIAGDSRLHARAVTEPINRQSLAPLHADVTELDLGAASDESKDSAPVSLSAALAASGMTGRAEEVEVPPLTASTRIVDRPVDELQDNQASGVRPTLVIGVGGVGGRVLARLHDHGARLDNETAWASLFPMIAVDVDSEALKALRKSTSAASLSPIDPLHLPLRRPQQYRERSPELLKWLSRRWLYNIPCSLKTRGYRPLGRLALVDNAETFVASIRTHWRRWRSRCEENNGSSAAMACRADDRPRVLIIAGSGGGTGGGVAIDVANAVRKIAQQCGSAEIEIIGLFADFSIEGSDASDLSLANTYAFLSELATAWRAGNCSQGEGLSARQLFEADAPPFEMVYFTGLGEAGVQADTWVEDAAEYLAADLLGGAGSTIEACRRTKSEPPADDAALTFVRSFAVASLADRWDILQLRARYDLCRRAGTRWLVASAGLPRHVPREKASGFSRVAEWVLRSAAKPTPKKRKPTPAVVLQSLRQAIAESLGELAIGSFAEGLLPYLAELLHDHTSKPTPEARAALLGRAHPVITAAHQALRAALERHAVDVSNEGQFEDFGPIIELVCRVEQAAVGRCLASLAEVGETSPDLGEMLWEEAGLALNQLTTCGDPDNLIIKLAGAEPDVAEIIDSTLIRPAGCSHQRRTIVVIPKSWPNDALDAEIARLRPGTAIARANVSHPFVIREAADLSLAQIAARLTETRPYAVEAACHLHARNDVAWLRLPRVEWPEGVDCSL